jgi:hypothetical protein
MTAAPILRDARARGIQLSASGDALHVKAPTGALDASLRSALTEHKAEILRLLASPQTGTDGGPLEQCVVCGCPTWWRSRGSFHWRCDHCEPRTTADAVCRVFVVAGGEWGKH